MQFIQDSSMIKSQKTGLKLVSITLCMLSPCAVMEVIAPKMAVGSGSFSLSEPAEAKLFQLMKLVTDGLLNLMQEKYKNVTCNASIVGTMAGVRRKSQE